MAEKRRFVKSENVIYHGEAVKSFFGIMGLNFRDSSLGCKIMTL